MSHLAATPATLTYVSTRIATAVANGWGQEEAVQAYRNSLYRLEARSPRVAARLLAALNQLF